MSTEEKQQNKRPKITRQPPQQRQPKTQPDQLVRMIAQLALRTETSLNMMLQEHQFIIHMHPGQGSLLPELIRGTQVWHQSNKELPLRHHLINIMWGTPYTRGSATCHVEGVSVLGDLERSWHHPLPPLGGVIEAAETNLRSSNVATGDT